MSNNTTDVDKRYENGIKLILLAAIVVLGLWFAYEVMNILLFFFFAIVLTLVLNAPTMWLVSKKVPRTVAALIVFTILLVGLFFLGKLVVPRILEQVTSLVYSLPGYYNDLMKRVANQLQAYPDLQKKLMNSSNLINSIPSMQNLFAGISRLSFSIIDILVLLVFFFSIVVYMLINPAPLIEIYLLLFAKDKRQKAAIALAKASKMMVGWMWSNFLVGSIEAVASFIFLSIMNVPGVWVWTGLTLFAEMIPKFGLYIMALPPTLIALSIDPAKGLWVLVFYLVLNEITGDFIMPRIRASTMNLHPVSTLFVMLIATGAFGLIGAFIATPLTAFIKAYYETFYLSHVSKEHVKEQVDIVLNRSVKTT